MGLFFLSSSGRPRAMIIDSLAKVKQELILPKIFVLRLIKVIGTKFFIMEYVEVLYMRTQITRLIPNTKKRNIREYGRVLARIHSVNLIGFCHQGIVSP